MFYVRVYSNVQLEIDIDEYIKSGLSRSDQPKATNKSQQCASECIHPSWSWLPVCTSAIISDSYKTLG